MAVKVGHARISETGKTYGKKGDQTGTEVCVTNWVNPGWDFVAIHPDAGVRERHAQNVEKACANDNVGYGQPDRNTLWAEYQKVGDIAKVGPCNTDCSELQNTAAVAANTPGVTHAANGWTTSTMKAALRAAGYKILTKNLTAEYAVRGAVYVKEGEHTVCALTNGAKAAQQLQAAGINQPSVQPVVTEGNKSFVGKGIGEGTARQDMVVRSGSSTSAAQIGVVAAGKKVEILSDPERWMQIVWPGDARGYAFTSNRSGAYYDVKLYRQLTGKVFNCYKLYVRKAPGGATLGTLDVGDEVKYDAISGKWLHIVSPMVGWVSGDYIKH